MSRDLRFRQQENPDLEDLKELFLYLDEYNLTPKRIDISRHYYWIHRGRNDKDSWWRDLFRYKDEDGNTMYGFYVGECDYT